VTGLCLVDVVEFDFVIFCNNCHKMDFPQGQPVIAIKWISLRASCCDRYQQFQGRLCLALFYRKLARASAYSLPIIPAWDLPF